jgi:hypothetical protein
MRLAVALDLVIRPVTNLDRFQAKVQDGRAWLIPVVAFCDIHEDRITDYGVAGSLTRAL